MYDYDFIIIVDGGSHVDFVRVSITVDARWIMFWYSSSFVTHTRYEHIKRGQLWPGMIFNVSTSVNETMIWEGKRMRERERERGGAGLNGYSFNYIDSHHESIK